MAIIRAGIDFNTKKHKKAGQLRADRQMFQNSLA